MLQYRKLVRDVIENGIDSDDRTGVGTKSVFGRQVRFDLSKGFPLLNLKRTYWKGVLVELLWLMRGETNVKFLQDRNVHIWNEWADENGDLGPVYGEQWRNWTASQLEQKYPGGLSGMDYVKIDQLNNAIETIKNNPNSRRIMVSAWNVGMIDKMKLPPCHSLFQFYVRGGKLSCQLYQRSADLFLGVPFNIASYACLTHLIAHECGLEVDEFIHTFGDLHLYKNHLPQCEEMLKRHTMKLPTLEINLKRGQLIDWIDNRVHKCSWDEITHAIQLKGYKSHPAIKGEVAV